jgi:hypothetical protein
MTPGSWAIKFIADILRESRRDRDGQYRASIDVYKRTAIRHFGKEVKSLERKMVRTYQQGRASGWADRSRI